MKCCSYAYKCVSECAQFFERQKCEKNYTNFTYHYVFVEIAGESFALPPCPKNTDACWDNYFGTKAYPGGNKYVCKLKDGEKRKGIFLYANGRVEEVFGKNGKLNYFQKVTSRSPRDKP